MAFRHIGNCSDKRDDLLKVKEEKDEEGDTVPCILDRLCTQHDGIPNEVS